MENYKKAYFLLFNAMTDAQQHILRCQPEKALEKLMQAQQDGCTQSQPDAPAGSQAACHCRSGVPVLSRKLPSRMVMRSTSVPMPPRPPVSSQSSPVPIFPT